MLHEQNRSTTASKSFPQTQYSQIERMLQRGAKMLEQRRVMGLQLTTIEQATLREARNIAQLWGLPANVIDAIEQEGAKAVRS